MDNKTLTKQWIEYLKGLKIVDLHSDPKTGRLRYKRPVTIDDVRHFLDIKTEYSADEIESALQAATSSSELSTWMHNSMSPADREYTDTTPQIGSGKNLSTWMHNSMSPGSDQPADTNVARRRPDNVYEPVQPKQLPGRQTAKIGHDPASVSDIDYKEVPDDTEKKKRKFQEALQDTPDDEIDERGIQKLFSILTSRPAPTDKKRATRAGNTSKSSQPPKQQVALSPQEVQAKKEDDIRKMKRLIRDVMTDSQRASLWRMLKDAPLTESQLNTSDIKAVFKSASDSRNSPSGLGRFFKGLRKEKIDISDLQQAWKDEGYPDDTRDITKLLLGHGFSKKDVDKVFSAVFGTNSDQEPDVPYQSATMLKIVQYAKANNIVAELISFMESEYGFRESTQNTKVMIEDVRRLFTAIVQEERTTRTELIKEQDKIFLGRTKK